jgi:hypothetical protein
MIRRYVNTGAECACGHGWQMFENPVSLCRCGEPEYMHSSRIDDEGGMCLRLGSECMRFRPAAQAGVCWHCAGGPLFCWKCDAEDKPLTGAMPFPAGIMGPLHASGLCDTHEEGRRQRR